MKTITQEEFERLYGTNGSSKFGQTEKKPGYLKRVAGDYMQSAKDIVEGEKQAWSQFNRGTEEIAKGNVLSGTATAAGGLVRGALRPMGEIAESAYAPIVEAVAPAIEPMVKKVIESSETAQDIIAGIDALVKQYPEASKDIKNVFDIALLRLGKTANKAGQEAISTAGKEIRKTVEPVIKATKESITKVPDYAVSRVPKLLGIFSGESDDTIKAALKNPEVAKLGIEQGDKVLRKAVAEGAENSIKIKNAFIKAHTTAKQKIYGSYSKALIPRNDVVGEFNKLLKANKVSVKNGVLDFTVSKIKANPGEISKIVAAYEALRKWDKFTIESLDDYKQLVAKLTKFATEAGVPSKSPFLGQLYNKLNQIATSKLPKDLAKKYLSLNTKFKDMIEMYDEVVDAFNSGDPFTKIANVLGKNKDTLRQVIDFYEKKSGKLITPIVAGRELALPSTTASRDILNPNFWVSLLISPRNQAEAVIKVGSKFYPKVKVK